MKKMILILLLTLNTATFAKSIQYTMRVDGLACPFCAYGIEKKLKAINGVKKVDVDLDKGLVVAIGDDINLNDEQMKQLFKDAGFTFRHMKKTDAIEK